MEYQDYYKILGVSQDASPSEIQRAYRKLARKFHPDVNKDKDAEEQFKRINEANEVLKDPEKRKLYDTYGKGWQQGMGQQQEGWREQQFSGRPRQEGFSRTYHFDGGDFEGAEEFSDFFKNLFGGGGFSDQHRQSSDFGMPGRSQEAEITVSLADTYHGTTKAISLQSYEVESNGQIRPVTKTLQVKIPRGVTNGTVIRLAGQGGKGSGRASAGDLLLRINIAPDPHFLVEGYDLYTIISISPWEAALGAKIPIRTVDGTVNLAIPKGSQNGKKLRLRGKGIPKQNGPPGDIIVELVIRMPDHLTHDEEVLFKEMARKSHFNPREKHHQMAGDRS